MNHTQVRGSFFGPLSFSHSNARCPGELLHLFNNGTIFLDFLQSVFPKFLPLLAKS